MVYVELVEFNAEKLFANNNVPSKKTLKRFSIFSLVGITNIKNLNWHANGSNLGKAASQKLRFLFRS